MESILINIPKNKNITETIKDFSPEENLIMLEIGSMYVIGGTKNISSLLLQDTLKENQKENEQKIQNIENLYKYKLDDLKKEIEIQKIKTQEYEETLKTKFHMEKEIFKKEMEKEKEFIEKERERTDKQFEKLQEIVKTVSSSKSTVQLGTEGENLFEKIAEEAFHYFDKFCMKNTANETSKGDYHLFFRDFSILVDTKNYKNSVGNNSKKKFKFDVENNKHMKIAWLVSLNTKIDCYDKHPVMFEFIGEQCIFYINHLLKYENPVEMLRILWSMSENINNILSKKEAGEENLQEHKTKTEEIAKQLDKLNKEENISILEMTKHIDKIRQNNKATKELLMILLNEHINTEITNEYQNILQEQIIDTVRKWCDSRLKLNPNNKKIMKYTEIWEVFEKDSESRRLNVKKMKFRDCIAEIYKKHINKYKNTVDVTGLEWITNEVVV